MIIKIYCKHCHKPLGENSLTFYRTAYIGDLVDGGRKPFCNERCYQKYLSKYFVEEYQGNKLYWIFQDNHKYYIPYVGCNYGFKTVQEIRDFIDSRINYTKKWKGKRSI